MTCPAPDVKLTRSFSSILKKDYTENYRAWFKPQPCSTIQYVLHLAHSNACRLAEQYPAVITLLLTHILMNHRSLTTRRRQSQQQKQPQTNRQTGRRLVYPSAAGRPGWAVTRPSSRTNAWWIFLTMKKWSLRNAMTRGDVARQRVLLRRVPLADF